MFGLNFLLLRSFQLLYGLFVCIFVKQPGCLSFAVEHKPKEDWLKKHGYWDEVLDRYPYKKNNNEGLVKKSRALYAEAINEIYMKHRA